MPAANPTPHAPDADGTAALVETVVRRVLSDVAVVEPIAVDGPTAAKLVGGCCEKTLSTYPPALTGRFKLNRRTMYRLETLKAFVKKLAEEQAA